MSLTGSSVATTAQQQPQPPKAAEIVELFKGDNLKKTLETAFNEIFKDKLGENRIVLVPGINPQHPKWGAIVSLKQGKPGPDGKVNPNSAKEFGLLDFGSNPQAWTQRLLDAVKEGKSPKDAFETHAGAAGVNLYRWGGTGDKPTKEVLWKGEGSTVGLRQDVIDFFNNPENKTNFEKGLRADPNFKDATVVVDNSTGETLVKIQRPGKADVFWNYGNPANLKGFGDKFKEFLGNDATPGQALSAAMNWFGLSLQDTKKNNVPFNPADAVLTQQAETISLVINGRQASFTIPGTKSANAAEFKNVVGVAEKPDLPFVKPPVAPVATP